LNIDYYLEEAVDEDHVDRILEYLQSSEKDDLVEAYQALGGDIPEEEIRLVRIKFISEAGN
jgi:ATP-dependent DNA helicase RecQ